MTTTIPHTITPMATRGSQDGRSSGPKMSTTCTAAEAAIDQALLAVIPLYGNSPDNQFTVESLRRIVLTDIPDADYDKAWLWVRALAGRRALGSVIGTVRVDHAGAWFASAAELGGTFKWAGITETRNRITKLRAATVAPVIARDAS